MFDKAMRRRGVVAGAVLALLAGCTVVPKPSGPSGPPPSAEPSEAPLPGDTARHRVALLVPLTGAKAAAGQSIANAANMALLDTSAQNLRITTYDTATGAAAAARRAVAEGNKLILGPLMADDVPAISAVARPAGVPLIAFSNDQQAASRDVFVMGQIPGQSVERTVSYARDKGISTFAALVPRGDYGERVSNALLSSVRASGGKVAAMEPYDRSAGSITTAARKLAAKGGYDAVLVADGGSLSVRAATILKPRRSPVHILGTELWNGDKEVTASPALNGALFATVSEARFPRFAQTYRDRFGTQPFRIATLGYDAVLLTLRVARDWKPGRAFPTGALYDDEGFLGLDGPLRFTRSGVVERALEVRQVSNGGVTVVSPAPQGFGK